MDEQEKIDVLADEILDFIATKNVNFTDFKHVWESVKQKSFKRFVLSSND